MVISHYEPIFFADVLDKVIIDIDSPVTVLIIG